MVLFKRKPVQYKAPPEIDNDDAEVWVINQTGEYFSDYAKFLERMDFYKQRRFICQITGHSGLSFFEALKSELAGAQEVEQAFPEPLKGPVLRRVQFQTISRIDTLVDLIFDEFKTDYYPGEAVTVNVVTGEKLNGVVRDKTRFGSKQLTDGTMAPGFSRYFVSLDNRPLEEAVVDDEHIYRDRKAFTKQVLRSFIKKTVTREAWTGAPWIVKPDLAAQFHIDTRVPPHLRYESKAAERKQKAQAQKAGVPDYEGMTGSFQGNGPRLPELKPAPKSHKSKQHQQQQSQTPSTTIKIKQAPFLNPSPSNPHSFIQQQPFVSHTFQAVGPPPQVGPHFTTFHNTSFALPPLASLPPPPPPPPPIKYPIEDLQVPLRFGISKRPAMKFMSQDTPLDVGLEYGEGNGILMKSVGLLLETWDTLSVYCEIFKLDSFTFDDFVEAMQFTSEDVECELFVEIHCATLKVLVQSEADGGKVQVQLPEMEEEDDEDDSEDEATPPKTPTPEPEPKPKGRATRSSLAKAEAEAAKAEAEAVPEPTPEPKSTHRADEMELDIGWIERLRKRDFKNGGWQIIMIGLLHQLSKDPRKLAACEVLLRELAPLNMDPTPETARKQYAKLDVNLRIQALQTVCMLTAETKAIRGYMEDCSEQMTAYRKEKIGYQRDRKTLLEELRILNDERKLLLPANLPPSPVLEQKSVNVDVPMPDAPEDIPDSNEDEVMDTDEDPHQGRSLRRGNDRALERKRKRDAEQEKKEKAEVHAKLPKQSKQFTKLIKDIQKKQDAIKTTEEEIAILDNDLREADCPRTRVLGKDRFWNRYYWFERNGMPYAGLPDSSTAEAGYANGRIWVQGPDEMEREGYIDMKPDWQAEYTRKFNMTVPDRKKMEEGPTSVFNAHEWGYYDDPQSLDALISWLDVRGKNELKLQKELKLYRDRIVLNMEKRKEYLNPTEEKAPKSFESTSSSKRMSTRRKEQPMVENTSGHRCLSWRNLMALNELGHLHQDQPRARKPAKKVQESKAAREREKEAARAAAKAEEEEEEEREREREREKEKGKAGKGKKKGGK